MRPPTSEELLAVLGKEAAKILGSGRPYMLRKVKKALGVLINFGEIKVVAIHHFFQPR